MSVCSDVILRHAESTTKCRCLLQFCYSSLFCRLLFCYFRQVPCSSLAFVLTVLLCVFQLSGSLKSSRGDIGGIYWFLPMPNSILRGAVMYPSSIDGEREQLRPPVCGYGLRYLRDVAVGQWHFDTASNPFQRAAG